MLQLCVRVCVAVWVVCDTEVVESELVIAISHSMQGDVALVWWTAAAAHHLQLYYVGPHCSQAGWPLSPLLLVRAKIASEPQLSPCLLVKVNAVHTMCTESVILAVALHRVTAASS